MLTPAEQGDSWFERQLAALPESYLTQTAGGRGRRHAAAARASLAPRSGAAWGRYLPDTDTVEFMAGVDQGAGRAIFSSMAGALTSNKMQILAAETNTLADGLLLMRYVASEPEAPGEPSAGAARRDQPSAGGVDRFRRAADVSQDSGA